MNLDDIYKNGVHTIEGTLIDLNCLTESDYPLIEELFSDSSVNLYFVLREDHRADLRLFAQYLLQEMKAYCGFTFIIRNKGGDKVGLIVGEFRQWHKEFSAALSFAILPQYRNHGYATEAVALSISLMGNSVIKNIILDISSSNQYSSNIAKLLGFMPENKPLYDIFHPEVGVRYNWIRQAPCTNDVIDIRFLREKKKQIRTIDNAVYLGFDSDRGMPLYWSKTNFIALKDNVFRFADSPFYVVKNNSYSEEAKDWDLFCCGDITGKLLESKLDNPPLDICDNINFDIVAAKIGNNWRLPSLSDFEKLEKYCDYEWTTDYDIAGMEFVSRINGQSIFFPALGLRAGNPGRVYGGGLGCYWTGTLNKYKEPYYFYFGRGGIGIKPVPLYYGANIRPVSDVL